MNAKGKRQLGGELRHSQVLNTFGPGALVDLPDYSVVISGLGYWTGDRQMIHEERLSQKVQQLLDVEEIKFYTPPFPADNSKGQQAGIETFIFPRWFLEQIDETYHDKKTNKTYRTRPFLSWEAIKGRAKFKDKRSTVPVRFVQACVNGHLSDIDWRGFAHDNVQTSCQGQLWLDEGGSGNDFEEIFVRCECGKRRPLSQAKVKDSKVLGFCKGERPWLGDNRGEGCTHYEVNAQGEPVATERPEYNRLLVRSASNAYFPQTLSVISLPDQDQALKSAVGKLYENDLKYEESLEDVQQTIRKPKPQYADLQRFPIEKVWAEIERRKNNQTVAEKTIKQVEIEALLACSEVRSLETDEITLNFDAQLRPIEDLQSPWKSAIDRIVLVHRLREVIAQIGFTRFEAAMQNIEGELDDLEINVRRGALDREITWVPAIENKGEGVFIAFDTAKIKAWCDRLEVRQRGQALEKGFYRWLDSKGIPRHKAQFPGLPYILLHSLSHLLITSISLDCGYAASAIRERVYANDTGYGILLYTGSSGSEGTLGGLVQVGQKLEHHLERALELGRLCSNDPVCAQHRPSDSQEDRFLHGAACHGCVLIAETSCERRNQFLDRALVIETVENLGAAFFRDDDF